MFCEVERSYIEDGFNLYGLRAYVSNFSDCLDLILDRIGPDDDSDDSHLTQSACTLYGLIHARYIITAHGLDAMYGKVRRRKQGKEKEQQHTITHKVEHSILTNLNDLFLLYQYSMPQKNLVHVP
jgi:Casein kinase II regulatory subunit